MLSDAPEDHISSCCKTVTSYQVTEIPGGKTSGILSRKNGLSPAFFFFLWKNTVGREAEVHIS